MSQFSRRDFLKLAGLTSGAVAFSQLKPNLLRRHVTRSPNVIILVFDATSARNLSLYGYQRETTPNIQRFADRANVYHAHHAAGNFTSPGTASLLTGTYPWTHRAFSLGGLVRRDLTSHNIFSAFGSDYHRLAFTQNLYAHYFLVQFAEDLDILLPPSSFSAIEQLTGEAFARDQLSSYRSFDNFLFQDGAPPGSLVFGLADRLLLRHREAQSKEDEYPNGLPRAGENALFYRLDDVFDGVQSIVEELQAHQPYVAYIHLWAPHYPYKPSKAFEQKFQDGFQPVHKLESRFSEHIPASTLLSYRQAYDQFIANVDAEFGRLMNTLEKNGVLDNSYVVLTADHGESFERGVQYHITRVLYEPLTHIPLLISSPGQSKRQDIDTPTSAVDVVPSLLNETGHPVPDWIEGKLLPGFGGVEDEQRGLFTVEAKENPAFAPLNKATVSMVKGPYKMVYYTGYEPQDSFECYDLEKDHEELTDLSSVQPAFMKTMQDELLEKLNTVNAPYRKD
jgi:arylsulfatase A-like enzyme